MDDVIARLSVHTGAEVTGPDLRLPSAGGDTQYVNMSRAYDELPEATKRRIAPLRAVHVYQSRHSARKLMELSPEARKEVPEAVVHPLVRTHRLMRQGDRPV